MTDSFDQGDAVDRYLDALLIELRGRVAGVRRILDETEDHLRESIGAGVAEGLTVEEAERRAVERFGSPKLVARRMARGGKAMPPVPVLAQVALVLVLVGGIALVGVGVSGAVADGMGAVFGKAFVSADTNGVTYTPSRCADFLEYHPEARTCEAAATAHHFDEVVNYRLVAGVLGLGVLGAWWLARRRRWLWPDAADAVPDGFGAVVGAALFGVAAAGLLFQSVGQIIVGGDSSGIGEYLSGGLVAAVIAMAFVAVLQRTLRTRAQLVD
jgi:hypothetical protein